MVIGIKLRSVWCFGIARPSSGSEHYVSDTNCRLPFFFSCFFYFWLFVFFIRSRRSRLLSRTSPGHSRATRVFQVVQTHFCQLLLNKRERTTHPRNHGALSVWFISTLPPLGSYSILLLLIDQSPTVGGGHFDPKTPFICCSPFACKHFLTSSTLKGSMGRNIEDSH
jgi:hypothetical protein